MKRRPFLTTVGAATLSGCQAVLPESGSDIYEFGETVEHDGLAVTPEAYTTADAVTLHVSDSMRDGTRAESLSAPEGAEYVLTRLVVEHVGENQREFPTRRTAGHRDIYHYYRDERLSTETLEAVSETIEVDSHHLPVYQHVLQTEGLTGSVYSGQAAGWLINEIPTGFDPEEAALEIVWDEPEVFEDEEPETTTWRFTEDAQVVVGEGT